MFFSHLLKEHVDSVLVGRWGETSEELSITEGSQDCNIVLVLLTQLDPNATTWLPDSSWPLPQISGCLVHVPDGLAYFNPLHQMFKEEDSPFTKLFLLK